MEEQQPLIHDDDEDSDDLTGPTSDIKRLIRRHRNRQSEDTTLHPEILTLNAEGDKAEDESTQDDVVCVFVIAFDTRQGTSELCRCNLVRYWFVGVLPHCST